MNKSGVFASQSDFDAIKYLSEEEICVKNNNTAKRQSVVVTYPWGNCVRLEINVCDEEGMASTNSTIDLKMYKAEMVMTSLKNYNLPENRFGAKIIPNDYMRTIWKELESRLKMAFV